MLNGYINLNLDFLDTVVVGVPKKIDGIYNKLLNTVNLNKIIVAEYDMQILKGKSPLTVLIDESSINLGAVCPMRSIATTLGISLVITSIFVYKNDEVLAQFNMFNIPTE